MGIKLEFLQSRKIILFNEYRLYQGLLTLGAIPITDNLARQRGYRNVLTELEGDAGIVHVDHPNQVEDLMGFKKMVVLQRVIGGIGDLKKIYEQLALSGVQLVDNRAMGLNGVDFWTNLVYALAVAVNSAY